MSTVFYRSNEDNKYYSNNNNKCYSNKNEICHSCNILTNKYYIFSRSISAIFENIKKEKYICQNCYNSKKKLQDKYSSLDKLNQTNNLENPNYSIT